MKKLIASIMASLMLVSSSGINVFAENTVEIQEITLTLTKDPFTIGSDENKRAGYTVSTNVVATGGHDMFKYQWRNNVVGVLKTETNSTFTFGNEDVDYRKTFVKVTPVDENGNEIGAAVEKEVEYVNSPFTRTGRRKVAADTETMNSYLTSPPENKFTVDGKSFILLDEFYSKTESFYILADDFYGKRVFDTGLVSEDEEYNPLMFFRSTASTSGTASSGEGNMAYWLNNDFLENGNDGMKLPDSIIENLAVHKWHNAQNKNWSNTNEKLKVALLGKADFVKYFGKFGVGGPTLVDRWWLRDSQGLANTNETNQLGPFTVICEHNIVEGTGSTLVSNYVRPAFYLTENFFKTVKIDLMSAGENVKKMLLERYGEATLLELYDGQELADAGMVSVPEVTEINLYGKVKAGNKISAEYTYYHEKNKADATTDYGFEISASKGGSAEITVENVSEYTIPADAAGKYITYYVIPKDEIGITGKKIYSESALIGEAPEAAPTQTAITDSEGNAVESLATADELKISMTLNNTASDAKDVVVLCGIYDKDDNLLANCAEKVSIPAQSTALSEAVRVINPTYAEGNYAKIMIWDSLVEMNSYYSFEIR